MIMTIAVLFMIKLTKARTPSLQRSTSKTATVGPLQCKAVIGSFKHHIRCTFCKSPNQGCNFLLTGFNIIM